MKKIVAIIPARMASSRFPGKPLTDICGIPMIQHVYARSKLSPLLSDVYVATCDGVIKNTVEQFGGKAIMTGSNHRGCTDRIAEAAEQINADIFVNVQGDEPLVTPEIINLSVKPLLDDERICCTNPIGIIGSLEEFKRSDTIKVVVDKQMNILYMSREPIPTYCREIKKVDWYKQICIISFTKKFLMKYYYEFEQTPLEITESIDMNRVLENGYDIKAVLSTYESHAVDTIEDKEKVEKMMKNDSLFQNYNLDVRIT